MKGFPTNYPGLVSKRPQVIVAISPTHPPHNRHIIIERVHEIQM